MWKGEREEEKERTGINLKKRIFFSFFVVNIIRENKCIRADIIN
jgi:hypothetical protein